MFDGLYFEYPKFAFLIFIFIACDAYCKLRSRAIYFPQLSKLNRETSTMNRWLWWLKWFGIILLVLSIMSPVRDQSIELAANEKKSVVMVIDNGRLAEKIIEKGAIGDFSRLTQVVQASFLEEKFSDIGLLLLNEKSYVASAMTNNPKGLNIILDSLAMDKAGGDLAEVVIQANEMLSQPDAVKKSIIVLTTSDYNSSSLPLKQLILMLNDNDVKLYSILLDHSLTKDESMLEIVASGTGGGYYHYDNLSELPLLLEKVKTLEHVDQFDYTFKEYFYTFPLFLSFFLFLISIYIRNRRLHG